MGEGAVRLSGEMRPSKRKGIRGDRESEVAGDGDGSADRDVETPVGQPHGRRPQPAASCTKKGIGRHGWSTAQARG